MPPQGRGRGGGTGGGAGRAGSAASADPGAGPSTSGCSGPASQLSLLPVPLLRAYRALPAAAEALLPAPVTQRPGGGGSAAGRGRGAGSGRLVALREGKEHLSTLDRELKSLPYPRPPQQAAAVAELLSTHPAETAALLRLYSAALRPGGEGEGSGGGGSGSGSGGSGGSMLGTSDLAEGWQANTAYPVYAFLRNCSPLTTCPHALSVLRFVLALLRAQTLPALSRRLAAAATNAAAGSSGGAGRAILQHSIMLIDKLHSATMSDGLLSDALPADVLSLRVICVEEYARGLAESGLLEHAARALLLLQARGPQRLLSGASDNCPDRLLHTTGALCSDLDNASLIRSMESRAKLTDRNERTPPNIVSPAAAAHLRSVLRGRCLQTAVLVYSVGTLRLLDGGPCYGLPPALQTAGRALRKAQEGGSLSAVTLDQLVSSVLPWRLGPGASLELALRTGWVAAAVASTASTSDLPPVTAGVYAPPPLLRQLSQTSGPCNTAALMVAALRRGRVLLTQQASSAGLVERRRGWWRLAASAAVYGMWDDGHNWYHLWQLWELATEPLMAMWPDGRLDLDTLPPASPPEVAAALAAGLLPALAASPDRPRSGPAEPRGSSKRLRGPFDDLLTACSGARPGDPGFALFLAPLLAYGEPGQAEGLLGALGRGLEAERGGGTGGSADFKPLLRAATSLLGALAGALQRCRRLGPAAGDALEGPVEVAAGEKGVVMESLDRGTCGATAEAAAAEGSGAWEVPGAEAGTCAAGAAVAEAAEGSGAGEAPAAAAAEGSGAGEAPAAAAAEGSGAGEAPGAEAGTCTDGKSSGAVPHEADGAREALSTDGGSGAAGEPFSAGPLWPPLQQLRRLAAYASELWGMPLPAQPAAVREEGEASA